MPTPETELILRALDDLRDDLTAYRTETRADFAVAFERLDETRQLVARLDERTRMVIPAAESAHADVTPAPITSHRERVGAVVRQHAPAAGVSAVVVALIELVPVIAKALGGAG